MSSVYSVGQVNKYIKNMFVQDYYLRNIRVRGEVSNCKYHTSGHIYFSLKDETGAVNCIMFAGSRKGLAFAMKDGDKVIVDGRIDVYERDGRYQLYASAISLEGAGALYERYLRLKQELEDMGMFDPSFKQPIPKMIHTLGVVTAPTGAAVQDIRNVSLRRNPFLRIILYPALVQGEGAAQSICRGIQMLDEYGVDVIIVGRGGGSIEDLWAFNEEAVARAIFECRTPIISAVGHETDTTIADFVADLRAPTPSAAAELAVDNYAQIVQNVTVSKDRLMRSMENRISDYRNQLRFYGQRLTYLSPQNRLNEDRQHLMELEQKLKFGMEKRYGDNERRLSLFAERLEGLSPLKKLRLGYSYVADEKDRAVTSIRGVQEGQILTISVTDGTIDAKVLQTKEEERFE